MLLLCVICILLNACAAGNRQNSFQNWKEGAAPITALKEYVDVVTDEKSEYYIPVEDRIAMFDLDGTLYCETFPIYGEWLLFADYVLNTPGYQAPEHIQTVAKELATILAGYMAAGLLWYGKLWTMWNMNIHNGMSKLTL